MVDGFARYHLLQDFFTQREVLTMKMYIKSVCVDDQAKALNFYTDTLGFVLKRDVPVGEFRWLTVVSKDESDGVELSLEPNVHPATKVYQAALLKDGIPFTAFSVDDLDAEFDRLRAKGVEFRQPPTDVGTDKFAVFNDTCGNLIQLVENKE